MMSSSGTGRAHRVGMFDFLFSSVGNLWGDGKKPEEGHAAPQQAKAATTPGTAPGGDEPGLIGGFFSGLGSAIADNSPMRAMTKSMSMSVNPRSSLRRRLASERETIFGSRANSRPMK